MHGVNHRIPQACARGDKKKLDAYAIPANKDKDGLYLLESILTKDGLAQAKALIRFYFHLEPKNFEEFARCWGQLDFALKFEGKIKTVEVKRG